jgi:hypothetical protein
VVTKCVGLAEATTVFVICWDHAAAKVSAPVPLLPSPVRKSAVSAYSFAVTTFVDLLVLLRVLFIALEATEPTPRWGCRFLDDAVRLHSTVERKSGHRDEHSCKSGQKLHGWRGGRVLACCGGWLDLSLGEQIWKWESGSLHSA